MGHLNNLDKNNFDSNYSPITSKEIDDLLGKLDKWTSDKTDIKKKSVEKEEDDVICLMDDENNKTDENDIDNLDVIGREYIKPINGLFCKLCKKFFMSEGQTSWLTVVVLCMLKVFRKLKNR